MNVLAHAPGLVGHVLLELRIPPPVEPGTLAAFEKAIEPRAAGDLVPLRPPLVLRATFTFDVAGEAESWPATSYDLAATAWLLRMVLVKRGFVALPGHVALEVLAKRTAPVSGVRVYLRTLSGGDDVGQEYASAGLRGAINPLPDQGLSDARTSEMCRAAGERPFPSFPPHQPAARSRRNRR